MGIPTNKGTATPVGALAKAKRLSLKYAKGLVARSRPSALQMATYGLSVGMMVQFINCTTAMPSCHSAAPVPRAGSRFGAS